MKLGDPYRTVKFSEQSMMIVRSAISRTDLKWNEGILHNSNNKSRKSEVAWVKDSRLLSMLFSMAQQMNVAAGWNLKLSGIEPVQFGVYSESDRYDWHVDQHNKSNTGMVRKISMSLFLNEDYEGGDFDLEIYKPEVDPRYKSFKLPKGSAIFFQGDKWHRVRPVTSGVRKSIVAWFYGPPYS